MTTRSIVERQALVRSATVADNCRQGAWQLLPLPLLIAVLQAVA